MLQCTVPCRLSRPPLKFAKLDAEMPYRLLTCEKVGIAPARDRCSHVTMSQWHSCKYILSQNHRYKLILPHCRRRTCHGCTSIDSHVPMTQIYVCTPRKVDRQLTRIHAEAPVVWARGVCEYCPCRNGPSCTHCPPLPPITVYEVKKTTTL